VLEKQKDGSFEELQTLSTLPEGFAGESIAAHIDTALDEKIIYVSNRGHNSIAVFERAKDGLLQRKQIALTGGNWPRFFKVLKSLNRVLVAHQKSNDIAIMSFDSGGYLSLTSQKLSLKAPVFIGEL
jgi:6-phosphogluconolactonase